MYVGILRNPLHRNGPRNYLVSNQGPFFNRGPYVNSLLAFTMSAPITKAEADRAALVQLQNIVTRGLFKAGIKDVNYHEDESISSRVRGYLVTVHFKKLPKDEKRLLG